MIAELISEQYTLEKLSNNLLTTTEHDSLRIWTNTNSWYWFSRGYGGGIKEWLDYNNYPKDDYEYWLDKETLPLLTSDKDNYLDYDDFVSHCIGNKVYHPYIQKRGISEQTANTFGLEVKGTDIIIPIMHYSNRIGSLVRHLNKLPKYHKFLMQEQPVFWNSESFDSRRPTLVFEGAWSVMRWYQTLGDKYNYIANLSFSISDKHFEYLTGLNNVYWFLDYDVDSNGKLLERVQQKGRKIKWNNNRHRVIANKTMPDDMDDEAIIECAERIIK